MNSIWTICSALLLVALIGTGCSSGSPKPTWHEEKAFLEEVIRWNWAPKEIYTELEITDSGNFLRNIEPVIQDMRNSGFFTERFCNEVERGYKQCDLEFRDEDIDDHIPCEEVDPVSDSGKEVLDSLVVVGFSREPKQTIVETKIFVQDSKDAIPVTYYIVRENDRLKIDHTSTFDRTF